jgi:Ala-tRNA(Pro) deacylase
MTDGDLLRTLDEAGISYEELAHERTERAADEAERLGVSPAEVAKTLVLSSPTGNVRAVLAAADRLDLHKVRELVGGGKRTRLLTEEDLGRDYPEFELGAVPPFSGAHRDRVLVDRRLADQNSVVLEAGSHVQSIRLATADLVRLTEAEVADITED